MSSPSIILGICHPKNFRRKDEFSAFLAKPNSETTIAARTENAVSRLRETIHFLAGVLTVWPLLNISNAMLKTDGEKLLVDGYAMLMHPELTTAFIRSMRKHEEKIGRVIGKIEKAKN